MNIPSVLRVLCTTPTYDKLGLPSKDADQFPINLSILFFTSKFKPGIFKIDAKLSMNSRDATSTKKWSPPFLIQASVSCIVCQNSGTRMEDCYYIRTLRANNWTFGFLWFSLRLSPRIASLGWTLFERIWSHISRLSAISSCPAGSNSDVAFSKVQGVNMPFRRVERVALTYSFVHLGWSP